MAKYVISKNVTSEMQQQYEEVFDTSNQSLWERLLTNALSLTNASEIVALPRSASHNPEHWLLLFRYLPSAKYSIENESFVQIKSTQWLLTNDEGSDDSDYVHLSAEE